MAEFITGDQSVILYYIHNNCRICTMTQFTVNKKLLLHIFQIITFYTVHFFFLFFSFDPPSLSTWRINNTLLNVRAQLANTVKSTTGGVHRSKNYSVDR